MGNRFETQKSSKWFFWSFLQDQELGLTDEAMAYLVSMLESFSRSEEAFSGVGEGQPVLVDFLIRAESASGAQQFHIYKHVGDLSLFLSGLFSEGLRASRSYYFSIGSGAYVSASNRARGLGGVVFEELGNRFEDVAIALEEIR